MSVGAGSSSSQQSSQSGPSKTWADTLDQMPGVIKGMLDPALQNPQIRVAGVNPLQQQAADNATSTWNQAANYGNLSPGSNQVNITSPGETYNGGNQFYWGNQASTGGPAAQGATTSAQFQGTDPAAGYTAAQMGTAGLGPAAQASTGGMQAISGGADAGQANFTSAGDAAQAGTQWQNGQAAQLGHNEYQGFMNPYINDVIRQSQTQMGRARDEATAARGARYASAGAFGGSRQAVADAVADSRYAQDFGNLSAGLYNQGFNNAQNLAQTNASRRQAMNQLNTQGLNNLNLQRDLTNRDAQNNMAQFNSGQANQVALGNAGFSTQAGIAAGSNATQASIANLKTAADLAKYNAGAQNQFGISQFNALNNASQQNAQMQNAANLYNAQAQNANQLQDSSILNNLNLQNALAQNNMSQYNAGQQNSMAQFGAGQENELNMGLIDSVNSANQANAKLGLQQDQLANTMMNDDITRQLAANGQLNEQGNQLRGIEQQIYNLPFQSLEQMGNLFAKLAAASRQSTSQGSSESSNFSLGLGGLGSLFG